MLLHATALLIAAATVSGREHNTNWEVSRFKRQTVGQPTCQKEAFLPVFGTSDCTRECQECNACVVIIIQLGCDVVSELEGISTAVKQLLMDFKRKQGSLPGTMRLGLIRYGLSRDIKIDLTLLDDINDYTNVIDDVLIKNIEDLKPIANAHPVPAFKTALQMFEDYEQNREDASTSRPMCRDKWIWYITNGHLQCSECICYPELSDPFNQGEEGQSRHLKSTWKGSQEKLAQFNRWRKTPAVKSLILEMCSDYWTETEGDCCLATVNDGSNRCSSSTKQRVCGAQDVRECKDDPRSGKAYENYRNFIDDEEVNYITRPERCDIIEMQVSLCVTRSRIYAKFEFDYLKCRNQLSGGVSIMASAPNRKQCQYRTNGGRRLWTDNSFEDCHDEEMLSYFNRWNEDLAVCTEMGFGRPGKFNLPVCAAYEAGLQRYGTFDVDNEQQTSIVSGCLMASGAKCMDQECRKTDCQLDIFLPKPTPQPSYGAKGCDGPRGPLGRPGDLGPSGAGGFPGAPGPDGSQGKAGPPGPPGVPGRPDTTRPLPGPPGPKGPPGPPGNPGRPGDHGPPGKDGSTGPNGLPGIVGQPGLPGVCGRAGAAGAGGRQGAKGPRGPQGPTGSAGVGIDSEQYFQEYKKILRSELQSNGPLANKVLAHLAQLIKTQYNIVCSPGHENGACKKPRVSPSWPWSPISPQCGLSPPLVQPTYQPTYRPPYEPTYTSVMEPVTTPKAVPYTTEELSEPESYIDGTSYTPIEETNDSSLTWDDRDGSSIESGSDSNTSSISDSDDDDSDGWDFGWGKRKRNAGTVTRVRKVSRRRKN